MWGATKRTLLVSENTPIQRIRTPDIDLLWKTVSDIPHAYNSLISAYCVKDKLANDPNCGLFAVFDGHGGKQVADHC